MFPGVFFYIKVSCLREPAMRVIFDPMRYKKLAYLGLIGIFLTTASFAMALIDDVNAVDRNGRVIESVTVDDDVYVSGLCSAAADDFVDAYVTTKRSNWKNDDKISDVTGNIERIRVDENGELELTRVWFSRLDVGYYDIVIDVDKNGTFEEGLDCVDSRSGTGFKVISKATGTVSEGSKNPDEDFKWEPEKDDPFVTFLQVRLRIDDQEDVLIEGIELSPRGSGNDRNSVLEVIVAEDRDNNGKYEEGRDRVLGIGKYEHDNRKTVVEINFVLKERRSVNLVIAYLMGKGLRNNQKFKVSLTDIEATGLVSEGEVRFSGLPITSIEMKTQGSGDAIEVRSDDVPPTAQSSSTGGSSSSNTSSAVLDTNDTSEGTILSGIFSSKNKNEREESGSSLWVPLSELPTVVIVILGIIGLAIIWKILRALFQLFI